MGKVSKLSLSIYFPLGKFKQNLDFFFVTTCTLARPHVCGSMFVVKNKPLSTVLCRERPTRPKSSSFDPVIPPPTLCSTGILQQMSHYEHYAVVLYFRLPLLRWLTLAVILILFVLIQLLFKINCVCCPPFPLVMVNPSS